MQAMRTVTLLLTMMTFTASAQDGAPDERKVLDTLHALCAAYERGDADYLARTLDADFTLTNSRGTISTRAQEVAELQSGAVRYETFRNHHMQARFYGDAAVVNGITSVKGEAGGEGFQADFQFTDTLVRRDAEWVLVASHATRLVPAP